MKSIYLYTLVAFFIFGCNAPQQNNDEYEKVVIPVIDVEIAVEKKQEILLSTVASDIVYLPLETRMENLIDNIRQVEVSKSYIFVRDSKRLFQFDRSGKFIRQIGKIGRGPGEYSGIMHFSVNEKANIILLQDEYQFLKYDFQGNFQGNIHIKYGIDFIFYRPDRIAFYRPNNVENPIDITITNQDFKPLYKFENRYPRPKSNLGFSKAPMFVFENELYFKEHFNDTLFRVKDSVLIPHIVFNERELLLDKNFDLTPTGDVNDLKKKLEEVKDKWFMNSICESKRFVFTSYYRGLGPMAKSDINILFDKINNTTFLIKDGEFLNDVDAGFDLWPIGVYQDNWVIYNLMSYELKTRISSNEFKNSTPKFPEKKKELEKLAASLDENDNPVLMLVKLK
jgi:hypothetical protein